MASGVWESRENRVERFTHPPGSNHPITHQTVARRPVKPEPPARRTLHPGSRRPVKPDPQTPTDPIVAEFLDEIGWSRQNTINAISIYNRWSRFLTDRGVTVLDAARADCVAYLTARREQVAANTARVDWRMLRAFYRWAATPVRDGGGGERSDDPMVGVKGPKVPKKPRTKAAKAEAVAALEAYFDQSELGRRNAAMVSLMWRSGVRIGELPALDLADYQVIGQDRAILAIDETKTDEPRVIPVHYETQRYLARHLRKRGSAADRKSTRL